MLSVFGTAVSALQTQQLAVDVIAHNLANLQTPGFKATVPHFEDLAYQTVAPSGAFLPERAGLPPAVWLGSGVRLGQVLRQFTQGSIVPSGQPLAMAIQGEGFFAVELPDGTVAYTRAGDFQLDAEGRLVTPQGYRLLPGATVPPEATEVQVQPDGVVTALVGGQRQAVGEVQLVRFANPGGLLAVGQNLFRATAVSGPPTAGIPGQEGFGSIVGGAVEAANVDVTTQVTALLLAQRAYALSARAVQTLDEMLALATGLRR